MNKSDLHRLIDQLPDEQTEAAGRILQCLQSEKGDNLTQALRDSPSDPLLLALAAAPDDDEAETAEELDAVSEALAESARGQGVSWEHAKRHLADLP